MPRVNLDSLPYSTGKKTRLHRILFDNGPGNGLAMILPIDHGLEHGPVDFFANPESVDPRWELRLAKEGEYSAIVFHYGVAEKYMHQFAGEVPLILKVNGKTSIPPDLEAFSPQTATVEDAVRLGADAIGYTLYVGSPLQGEDFRQFQMVRREADRYSMPIIVWAYPRGKYIEEKGGRDSLYAIEYAARTAVELGADVVKLNVPVFDAEKMKLLPKPYDTMRLSMRDAIARLVTAAAGIPVLISGGGRMSDQDLLDRAWASIEAGASGLIFGRNMFQRSLDEAISISNRIKEMMRQTPRSRGKTRRAA
ncbi:MAG: fructose-bisphosphate aldolase [Chloroflexi bacterium]|nr:fructose-bisphosphate aldolase [Chloroflexota bacterium]